MSTIQDVFVKFYPSYLKAYRPSAQQAKAAQEIIQCRTGALGCHIQQCDHCDSIVVHNNSCRNRHCPMCQGVSNTVWVDARSKDLLDAPYFHVVLTVPEELRPVIYQNQEILYPLLYKCVAQTLQELSSDPKHLGAQIGFFSLLHTWGQNLHYHPHIHTVVLAGGLTKTKQWREGKKDFFVPVQVLSKLFRGKFMSHLKQYYEDDKLYFWGDIQEYKEPKAFDQMVTNCYGEPWYSYSNKTFSTPTAVLKYLGNYTRRVAISNSRIVSINDTTVTIKCKDRKDSNKWKVVTLTGVEFIRRFLLHVLPKGFVKIRHYGILANRNKKTKLALCKRLTRSRHYTPLYEGLSAVEVLSKILGRDITLCSVCNRGRMRMPGSDEVAYSP